MSTGKFLKCEKIVAMRWQGKIFKRDDQVAESLGVSVELLRTLSKKGHLTALDVGKDTYVSSTEAKSLIKNLEKEHDEKLTFRTAKRAFKGARPQASSKINILDMSTSELDTHLTEIEEVAEEQTVTATESAAGSPALSYRAVLTSVMRLSVAGAFMVVMLFGGLQIMGQVFSGQTDDYENSNLTSSVFLGAQNMRATALVPLEKLHALYVSVFIK